ncbi:MAG TPA: efflux transporter outer membrane subunit [Trinickia sp.]|uniref:efflux transporter outer membrane subunit n=1 Tax=Trinickia sp. TaxID=2571163 RepID=UPI002B728F21|nr:efflux transporter outer membrane subunit [Trinickia sp.]HTI19258.1 efflux transporter outer membrane subunit [Trinickia sp.]
MLPTAIARSVAPFAVLMLAGCLLGPDYVRPKVDIPEKYRFEDMSVNEAADKAWWKQFQDPVLDNLIATALADNKDLMVAAARVEEFRGQFISTRSALFPQLSAGFDPSRQRASGSTPVPFPAGGLTYNQFQADISAFWNIDLFGQYRRQTEAARAGLLASEEARRATIVTLVAAVASSYINLRSLDQQLDIAKSTAASRAESVNVFTLRFKYGEVSQMELAQSESEYQAALATIPQVEAQVAQQEDALSVLLGRNPEPIARGRSLSELGIPELPSTSLPAALLDNRPDLRQAEENLVAQNALVGAARALYFPTISLSGLFGTMSAQFSNMFTGPARVWSYAGAVSIPIFTGGNITGQNRQADARRLEALFAYEKAIEQAYQQVADAFIVLQKSREQLQAQGKQVDALVIYARLARMRYEGGYTSYIDVLDSERSLFNAQLTYAQLKGTTLTAMVNLYVALGGPWVGKAETMTAPPQEAASRPSVQQAQPVARATP